MIAGWIHYIIGTFLVTVTFNVPLNTALTAADFETESGRRVWENYLAAWTYWNHIRAIASIAATAMLMLSMLP